jgi:hypothetical protein
MGLARMNIRTHRRRNRSESGWSWARTTTVLMVRRASGWHARPLEIQRV